MISNGSDEANVAQGDDAPNKVGLLPSSKPRRSSRKSIISSLSSRSSDVSSLDYERDIDKVPADQLLLSILRGKRRYPLSQRDFQEYLDSTAFSGELAQFFIDVEHLERTAGSMKRGPQAKAMADEIANKYIRRLSSHEINISDDDRQAILNKLDDPEAKEDYGRLFYSAKEEVLTMLRDKLPGFVKEQTETNITEFEAKRRCRSSLVLLLIAAAIIAVIMYVQTLNIAPWNVRWWRTLAFPFLWWAIGLWMSGRLRLCTGLARVCVRMREHDMWFWVCWRGLSKKKDQLHSVEDHLARRKLRMTGLKIELKSFVCALVVMAIVLAVPPGYNLPQGIA